MVEVLHFLLMLLTVGIQSTETKGMSVVALSTVTRMMGDGMRRRVEDEHMLTAMGM